MQTRYFQTFPVSDFHKLKMQMLNWCSRFNISAFLDNHQYDSDQHQYEVIAGCGADSSIVLNSGNALGQLQDFINKHHDWCFGHFGYGLMQETEGVLSKHTPSSFFSDMGFFIPEVLLCLSNNQLTIGSLKEHPESIWKKLTEAESSNKSSAVLSPVYINCPVKKEEYLEVIQQLKDHISRGDCYEINYCLPFSAENVLLDPVAIYSELTSFSPNPYSAFYKWNGHYLFCGSPERFLSRRGNKLLSQPMKGTISRNRKWTQSTDNKVEGIHMMKMALVENRKKGYNTKKVIRKDNSELKNLI